MFTRSALCACLGCLFIVNFGRVFSVRRLGPHWVCVCYGLRSHWRVLNRGHQGGCADHFADGPQQHRTVRANANARSQVDMGCCLLALFRMQGCCLLALLSHCCSPPGPNESALGLPAPSRAHHKFLS